MNEVPLPTTQSTTVRRWSFRLGATALAGAAFMQLPSFWSARDDHYAMSMMGWDPVMTAGMVLLAVGFAAVGYAILPSRGARDLRSARTEAGIADSGRLYLAHVRLAAVLMLAIAIDMQKPFTFAFILPSVAREYGLAPAHPGALTVAWLPFA